MIGSEGSAVIELRDERATQQFGARLGAVLAVGDIVLLEGPLGVGKTTLARAVIAARCGGAVQPSPTFSLVETYDGPDIEIWHFDLYRLEAADDVWELGLEDALENGACLIEWPDRAESLLPDAALRIALNHDGAERRAMLSLPESWRSRRNMLMKAEYGTAP